MQIAVLIIGIDCVQVRNAIALTELIERVKATMAVDIVTATMAVEKVMETGSKSIPESLMNLPRDFTPELLRYNSIEPEPKLKKPLWFQGSEKANFRVPSKKQNSKYNQRSKLRNNKHKK